MTTPDSTYTITVSGTLYHCDVYTTTGAFTWTPPTGVTAYDVLIVAGGGSGRRGANGGGGGGAGGLLWLTAQACTPGVGVSGSVGAGGAAKTVDGAGNMGTDSVFGSSTAVGGGGGAFGGAPMTGGSGGGGAGGAAGNNGSGDSGTSGQGNAGGSGFGSNTVGQRAAGGGGGAGSVGANAGNQAGGNGGTGTDMSAHLGTGIGESGWFASGGGGGTQAALASAGTTSNGGGGHGGEGAGGASFLAPQAGQASTGGGGGGGGGNDGGTQSNGAAGGSGVVIIRYVIPDPPGFPANLAADPALTSIDFTWDPPASGGTVTGYEVRLDGGSWVDKGTSLSHTFTGLTPATEYDLFVRAYGPGGTSASASIPNVETDSIVAPGVPTNVAETHDDDTITLTWDPPVTGDPVDEYELWLDGVLHDTTTDVFFVFDGLTPEDTYLVQVKAVNDGGASSLVGFSVTTDPGPGPGEYSFDIVVGAHAWDIDQADAAELGTVLAGLKVAWTARQDDGWPTQHNPMQATFGVIVEEAVDFSDVDLGTPVYLHLEIDDVTVVEFGGTVRDISARPHPRGMVYQLTALDYLVDLREKRIEAEIVDEFADYEDIWDILTDGVLPSGMPSLFDPPGAPYPGIVGSMGSTFAVQGNAMDVLVGYFGQVAGSGSAGFRNIIVPNLTDGLPDEDHPYLARRAGQAVGETVEVNADVLPTDAVEFRRLRQEPNRAELWEGGVIQAANERDHDDIPTITRVVEANVNTPPTSIGWIATNLEDLPNQWSTLWRLRAWEDPSVVVSWFTMPEAMRTLVHITNIDPRHNPSGETEYSGMLAGAALIVDPRARWRVDFTLRRSVPEGTVLP